MCQMLCCKQSTLNSYLEKMGIQYIGNMGGKGMPDNNYVPAAEQCKRASCKPYILKLKLFREGIKEEKCELCGEYERFGIKIPLEIHHVDCNHFNNNLDNIMILCPTCHSIQPGNSGSNMGKYTSAGAGTGRQL